MERVKIRRVGNSNVVSLSPSFEPLGYSEGTEVIIESLDSGALLVLPASRIREHIRQLGQQIIAENRGALEQLAAHDRADSEK